MFKLYILSVNTFSKIRKLINKVITGKKPKRNHFIKDTLFDI